MSNVSIYLVGVFVLRGNVVQCIKSRSLHSIRQRNGDADAILCADVHIISLNDCCGNVHIISFNDCCGNVQNHVLEASNEDNK